MGREGRGRKECKVKDGKGSWGAEGGRWGRKEEWNGGKREREK